MCLKPNFFVINIDYRNEFSSIPLPIGAPDNQILFGFLVISRNFE